MATRRLSIIGLGLLGGSVGRAVKTRLSGWEVTGYDVSAEAISTAKAIGAIDRAADHFADCVAGADLVVVATPVGTMPAIFDGMAAHLGPSAIVTDVGSTKRSVCEAAERCLPAGRFVGSHPMAGSEKSGVRESRADLFDGATCIVTPTVSTTPAAVEQVQAFWRSLGGRTMTLSPADHDAAVARVSHLPHVVAAAVVNIQSAQSLQAAGKGFADLTRIAAGDASLWLGILLDNRDEAVAAIQQLISELQKAAERLRAGDKTGLRDWLQSAAERRRGLQITDRKD